MLHASPLAAGGTGYYVIVIAAILVLGISKTGFGGGGIGILSVPLMASVMPAEQMLAVLAVLFVAVDLLSNLHYLGDYDWPVLKWMLPGAVLGVLLGCWIIVALRGSHEFDRRLTLSIGALCLLFVAAQVIRFFGGRLPMLPSNPGSSVVVGAVAGTVSAISHAAGPIVALYLLQERVSKRRLVGTMLLYTFLINSFKLVSYIGIHTVTAATFRQTLWMLPILPAGTLAGAWMNKRLPERPFTVIMYAAAALAAGQMIYKAVA